jgi:hypothetical protein
VPRRIRAILLLAPLLIALALWALSFRRCELWGNSRWAVMSELGAVYVGYGDVARGYSDTPTGENGVLEEETGSVRRRWLPVWAWSYKGDRIVSVQWWAIAAASAAPPVWD